jgi:coenzyme PQQ synthesis protein D (PqqD)
MRISETVRTATNQDGAVLMDISRGQMFSINPVGWRIWQQLKDGHTPEDIAEAFVTDFGISREQALNDVSEFVQQLEEQQLFMSPESHDSGDKFDARHKGSFWKLLGRRNSKCSRYTLPGTEAAGNKDSR